MSADPAVPEPFKVPLINLLVERKTDLLAAAAFVLSAGAVLFQLVSYTQGPRVHLLPPEQVLLNFVPVSEASDAREFLRIAARMAYVNDGQPGFNASLRRESVSFTMNGVERVQRWQSEQQFTDLDHDGEIETKYIAEAQPRAINAGSSLSREMYFSPFPIRCPKDTACDRDRNFVFKTEAIFWIFRQKDITLTFTFELFGQHPVRVSCTIEVDDRLKIDLMRPGWSAPPCWSSDHKFPSAGMRGNPVSEFSGVRPDRFAAPAHPATAPEG